MPPGFRLQFPHKREESIRFLTSFLRIYEYIKCEEKNGVPASYTVTAWPRRSPNVRYRNDDEVESD